jgi:hypothetical protein
MNHRGSTASRAGNRSEGAGLSKLVAEKCEFLVAIPQYGKIGSLNAVLPRVPHVRKKAAGRGGMTNYESFADRRIAARLRGGDPLAKKRSTRGKAIVRSKARTYFLVGADREDIIQEGMIACIRRSWTTSSTGSVVSCVCGALHHAQIITAIKSATRKKHIPLNTYISFNRSVFEGDNSVRSSTCLPARASAIRRGADSARKLRGGRGQHSEFPEQARAQRVGAVPAGYSYHRCGGTSDFDQERG